MKEINFKKEVPGNLDQVIERLTAALQKEGFGVLTRIDLHQKIKEKLNKDLAPAVILGACNPQLAYEAYQVNTNVASLLPCNAVLREVAPEKISVELASASFLMEMVDDQQLAHLGQEADLRLHRVLDSL
jgi:uncharacterized protein (DUF302 family)